MIHCGGVKTILGSTKHSAAPLGLGAPQGATAHSLGTTGLCKWETDQFKIMGMVIIFLNWEQEHRRSFKGFFFNMLQVCEQLSQSKPRLMHAFYSNTLVFNASES